MTIVIPEIYHSPGTSSSFAHPSRRPSSSENCALASSKVATRSARVTGPLTVRDQNQAQTVGTAAGLVDATNIPLATVDGVVRAVLVDPGAKAGRAHGQSHHSTAAEWDDAA